MRFRAVCLMGIAVCMTATAFAQDTQEVKPVTLASPAPQAATPAPPPPDAKTIDAEVAVEPAEQATAAEPANSLLEGELDADKIMAAQKAGYKIKNENGQTLLCRRDKQTGSHVRYRTSCLTAREWEQLRSDNEQMLKAIERRPRTSTR